MLGRAQAFCKLGGTRGVYKALGEAWLCLFIDGLMAWLGWWRDRKIVFMEMDSAEKGRFNMIKTRLKEAFTETSLGRIANFVIVDGLESLWMCLPASGGDWQRKLG